MTLDVTARILYMTVKLRELYVIMDNMEITLASSPEVNTYLLVLG